MSEEKLRGTKIPDELAEYNRVSWAKYQKDNRWLDNNIGSEKKYGGHKWSYGQNSDDKIIVKCVFCGFARMYLHLFDMTHCEAIGGNGN